MKRLFLALLYLYLSHLLAQTPDTSWSRTYGGTLNEAGIAVRQTVTDGGYVIAGYTESFVGYAREAYFIKTDAAGDTIWTNRLGIYTTAVSIVQTSDGGYAATGSYYNNGYANLRIWKMDAEGNYEWGKIYNLGQRTYGQEIHQLADTGYIVVGTVYDTAGYSDIVLLKTDPFGNAEWTKIYDLGTVSVGLSVDQIQEGGYIITGYVYAPPYFDVLLLRCDTLGDTLWMRSYGGNYWDEGHCVRQTNDGGYIIAGQWGQSGSDQDVYIVKTDEFGNVLWTKQYNGGAWDCAESIDEINDRGYIVAGCVWQPTNHHDLWLLRIDLFGDTLWTAIYGGTQDEVAYSVVQTIDGGYIVTGQTNSFGAGGSDIWLLKTEPDTIGIEDDNRRCVIGQKPIATIFNGRIVYPEDSEYRVFDIAGRVIDPDQVHPGIYFIEIGGVVEKKVVIVR